MSGRPTASARRSVLAGLITLALADGSTGAGVGSVVAGEREGAGRDIHAENGNGIAALVAAV